VSLAAAAFLSLRLGSQEFSSHTHLRIGLVNPGTAGESAGAASVARGVRLGASESRQTAALFGDDVELYEENGDGGAALTGAERLLSRRKVQILIGASPADADALSRFAESQRVVFVNAGSRLQSLRAACRRYTFHIEATDAMYENVRAQRHQSTGAITAASARTTADPERDSVALWGPTLERFGASQLNARYRDRYHIGMDGNAWAGWAAVKIAAEAALRTRSTSPARILAYLESPTTQFDGHKGWPLTFRLADHQLRQPLYVVTSESGDIRFRDVPELRAVSANGEDDAAAPATDRILDLLVAAPEARACKWARN
jgi:hypothetical protein